MPPIDTFREALLQAALASARDAAATLSAEGIYGFALYTSGEYNYVCDSVATERGLDEVAAKYLAMRHYATVWRSTERARAELRWSPADSPRHGAFRDHFTAANAALDAVWAEANTSGDDGYWDTIDAVESAFVDALRAVRAAGVLGEGVIINLLMGDQSDESRVRNAAKFNPPATLAPYREALTPTPVFRDE